jgi:cobalt-zinc-cadmium resistance protein CzcA
MVTGVRSQLAVKVFGDDLDGLRRVSEDVARLLRAVPGSRDIRIERLSGQQSLTIDIDRKAIARHGINVADVHALIETAIGGKEVSTVYEGERRFGIAVRFPEASRNSIEAIGAITLRAPDGALVPLASVARIALLDGPAQISREGGKRRVVVGANVEGRDLGGFVAEVQERLAREVKLPEGYSFVFGGQFENMERAMGTLAVIVPLTIAAIFFLLFMLFRSLKLASLIILVLPFASIGGLIGLFVTREYLSVPASVGFIALWGIAVLNGVVLVTCIRRLREDGLALAEAVREGCILRFRPVMMTATVALLGLVPFLFASGPGSEVQKPLAVVVIGGLITSTLLTLVVLPVLYRWFDDRPQEA